MIPVAPTPAPMPAPAPPLRAGANVRMGRNPLGIWMDAPSSGADFRHPYLVTVGGMDCRLSHGLVLANISVEPKIGGEPISGNGGPQPVLKLRPGIVNEQGESWVCVEVTPDEDGKLDAESEASKVEVVQRDNPFLVEGPTGRAPLALLVDRKGRWQVFQIAMFHYRYETTLPATGLRRHFFQ